MAAKRDIFGKFYNPTKLLSYNKVLNFSIGSRSIGKSTGFALYLLREFIEKGRQFIYCRRTDVELGKTAHNYFDNAIDILKMYGYEIDSFVYSGSQYLLNGEVAGYAIPLSLQQRYKSGTYSNVFWILYDEFLLMPGSKNTYIGGNKNTTAEVDAMVSLFQTVDRGIGRAFRDEARIIFLGNAGTFFNPFFINYGIDRYLRPDTKYLAPKDDVYVVEMTHETEATKDIKSSNGYKISTAKTKSYAYDNNFADLKGEEFILKKPEGVRTPLCNFIYDGNSYGVFAYFESGYIYVCHDRADGRANIALTTADHRPNYLMISSWHNHPITKKIKEMYDKKGSIRFYDFKCKMAIDFYLAYDV